MSQVVMASQFKCPNLLTGTALSYVATYTLTLPLSLSFPLRLQHFSVSGVQWEQTRVYNVTADQLHSDLTPSLYPLHCYHGSTDGEWNRTTQYWV